MEYFFSIFFGTFLLEDLALASSLALVAENKMSLGSAFLSCFLGICIGDIGLYGLGFIGSRFQLKSQFLDRIKKSDLLGYSIVISRMIPGTRFVTYVGAGYVRYSFLRFCYLTFFSVFVWVFVALSVGATLNAVFANHWAFGLIAFLLFLHVLKSYGPKLADKWERRALMHGWRKWSHFEFWPAWFFYLPIVPYYIFLSCRHGSLFMPFYAAPELRNGGLIGESKWDFLQHLKPTEKSTLNTMKLNGEFDFLSVRKVLDEQSVKYPFIMKPDVGQRGFGVRIIRNDFELKEYLQLSPFDRIVQKLSLLENEAGLFYVRRPLEATGRIFSVTDKKFPVVIGDGKAKLGDLILLDSRARIMASVYFSRLRSRLDEVIASGERVALSECGNHCQGAIFLNGNAYITDAMTVEVDRIAKQIPNFYFGRFDVRYRDVDSLMQGHSFEIVEVNGAGSEATHIWDARTKLSEAYRTLFDQWGLLFAIGAEVRRSDPTLAKVNVLSFLKECFRVVFRRDSLSVSS